jgi:hypothetical protein
MPAGFSFGPDCVGRWWAAKQPTLRQLGETALAGKLFPLADWVPVLF